MLPTARSRSASGRSYWNTGHRSAATTSCVYAAAVWSSCGAGLTKFNKGDKHGVTSHLSKKQIDDLAEFLLSL